MEQLKTRLLEEYMRWLYFWPAATVIFSVFITFGPVFFFTYSALHKISKKVK